MSSCNASSNGRLVQWAIGYIAAAFAGSIWWLLLKISEDRYQFGRLTVFKETTPARPGAVDSSHAVEKDREILVPFGARCAKWVTTNS